MVMWCSFLKPLKRVIGAARVPRRSNWLEWPGWPSGEVDWRNGERWHSNVTASYELATYTMLFCRVRVIGRSSCVVICGQEGVTLGDAEGGGTREGLLQKLPLPPSAGFEGIE